MADVTRHDPGSHCWSELATSDPGGARKFYTSLFGWEAEDSPAGPDMVYTMLRLKGRDVGALFQQDKGEAEHGIPPHWNLYIAVASADNSAARAKELGGKVLMEPFDVMEHGRMAIVQDPTGGTICVWQARNHVGARVAREPGAGCWCELYTSDPKKAGPFYAQLFAWNLKETPGYTEFYRGETAIAGMMAIEADWGPVPPHWIPYFQTADLDATAKKAQSLGARFRVEPRDIPEVGRFAIVLDPQGAEFALIRVDRP